jgi:hypothetical protein
MPTYLAFVQYWEPRDLREREDFESSTEWEKRSKGDAFDQLALVIRDKDPESAIENLKTRVRELYYSKQEPIQASLPSGSQVFLKKLLDLDRVSDGVTVADWAIFMGQKDGSVFVAELTQTEPGEAAVLPNPYEVYDEAGNLTKMRPFLVLPDLR